MIQDRCTARQMGQVSACKPGSEHLVSASPPATHTHVSPCNPCILQPAPNPPTNPQDQQGRPRTHAERPHLSTRPPLKHCMHMNPRPPDLHTLRLPVLLPLLLRVHRVLLDAI